MIKCRHITISLTNDCNMNCRDCYVDQKKEYFEPGMLREIIDVFLQMGGRSIGFSGGEPLLHANVLECIAFANAAGLETSLVTNGILFHKKTAMDLRKAGLKRVQISLDAGNRDENDRLRQKGAFDVVIEQAIPSAKEAGLKTTLVAVPNTYLMKNVKEYLDLAGQQGVDAVYFRRFVDWKSDMPNQEQKESYYAFLETLEKVRNDCSIKIYLGDPMHGAIRLRKLEKENEKENKKKMFAGCSAGITSLSIQVDGTVYPCTRLPVFLGNIYRESLKDIWEHSSILHDLRMRKLSGNCGRCSYRYVCGGCRAEAYYKGKDYLGEDPMCCMIRED